MTSREKSFGLPGDRPLKVAAIIPAAGFGTRMKSDLSKQFLLLDGKPLLYYTLSSFDQSPVIDEIVLVLSKEEREAAREKVLDSFPFKKNVRIADGGAARQDSVLNGLLALDPDTDFVVIHDGCRPFVTPEMIEASLEAAKETGGAITAIQVRDTLKKERQGMIEKTVIREGLWQAQTPQTFRYRLLLDACRDASRKRVLATDDAGLVERMGGRVKISPGSVFNIKVTLPEDFILAEVILKHRKELAKPKNV
jgi:2-C-methyl-D-erythritol 4-phosphate cytidylyltransferase